MVVLVEVGRVSMAGPDLPSDLPSPRSLPWTPPRPSSHRAPRCGRTHVCMRACTHKSRVQQRATCDETRCSTLLVQVSTLLVQVSTRIGNLINECITRMLTFNTDKGMQDICIWECDAAKPQDPLSFPTLI